MTALYIALVITAACSLFVAGIYTGIWIMRHNTVEVPKIITTEKVVEHEVPKIIQVPVPAPPRPRQGPALPIMEGKRSVVADPVEKAEAEQIMSLLGGMPEV